MILNDVILILVIAFIPQSSCLNALFISIGFTGHVTPMCELAQSMKNHNVTFLTLQSAQVYINLNLYSSPSFRIIYANDSPNAFFDETNHEQEIMLSVANRSVLDSVPNIASMLGEMVNLLLNKTIYILTYERFDVIVAGAPLVGVSRLCEKAQTPCVIQIPALIEYALLYNDYIILLGNVTILKIFQINNYNHKHRLYSFTGTDNISEIIFCRQKKSLTTRQLLQYSNLPNLR
jgi:hypothetical protein